MDKEGDITKGGSLAELSSEARVKQISEPRPPWPEIAITAVEAWTCGLTGFHHVGQLLEITAVF